MVASLTRKHTAHAGNLGSLIQHPRFRAFARVNTKHPSKGFCELVPQTSYPLGVLAKVRPRDLGQFALQILVRSHTANELIDVLKVVAIATAKTLLGLGKDLYHLIRSISLRLSQAVRLRLVCTKYFDGGCVYCLVQNNLFGKSVTGKVERVGLRVILRQFVFLTKTGKYVRVRVVIAFDLYGRICKADTAKRLRQARQHFIGSDIGTALFILIYAPHADGRLTLGFSLLSANYLVSNFFLKLVFRLPRCSPLRSKYFLSRLSLKLTRTFGSGYTQEINYVIDSFTQRSFKLCSNRLNFFFRSQATRIFTGSAALSLGFCTYQLRINFFFALERLSLLFSQRRKKVKFVP